MCSKPPIQQSVESSLERKDANRRKLLEMAKCRFEKYANNSGAATFGRDENGNPVAARYPQSLGISVNGWNVRTVFKREDLSVLTGTVWRDVEMQSRREGVPVREISAESHIITAVRALKHVREGYAEEVEKTIGFVSNIIRINQEAAAMRSPISDEAIRGIVEALRGQRPVLAKKSSAIKKIIGLGRLDDAISRFESLLQAPASQRALAFGRACAVLSSVPERLTSWRDERIAGGVAYTLQRECSLRYERDRWLFSQLARFSCSVRRLSEFIRTDDARKEALGKVRAILDDIKALEATKARLVGVPAWSEDDEKTLQEARGRLVRMESEARSSPYSDAESRKALGRSISNLRKRKSRTGDEDSELASLEAQKSSLKEAASRLDYFIPGRRSALKGEIRKLESRKGRSEKAQAEYARLSEESEGKRQEALRCIWANAAIFNNPPGGKKPEVLAGDIGWLHRNIKNNELSQADARLVSMVRFLDSNKPRFILGELSKSPDPYLGPVLQHLGGAVSALEAGDEKSSQKSFAMAALEMRGIVYPDKG